MTSSDHFAPQEPDSSPHPYHSNLGDGKTKRDFDGVSTEAHASRGQMTDIAVSGRANYATIRLNALIIVLYRQSVVSRIIRVILSVSFTDAQWTVREYLGSSPDKILFIMDLYLIINYKSLDS
jgi:hypothetical protein